MSSIVFNNFKKRFLEGEVPSADTWKFSLMNRDFNIDFNKDNFSLEQFRTTADLEIYSNQREGKNLENYYTDGNIMTYTWDKVPDDGDLSNKPMFINKENYQKFKNSIFWDFFKDNKNLEDYISDEYRGKGFYVIRSKDELSWFADRTNSGNNKIIGVLSDHISGEINNIIGKEESYPFMGILDGNGFIIQGVKIICDSVNNGIVGVLGDKGIIRNFEISNDDKTSVSLICKKRINLKHIKEDGRNVYAGILVGKNFGTIENIYVKNGTKLDISGFIPQVYSVTNKSDDYNDFMEIRKKYSNSVGDNFYYLNSFCLNSPGNICPYVGYFNEGLFGENILFKNSKGEIKNRLQNLGTSGMGGYYYNKFINSDNFNGMKISGKYHDLYSYCLLLNSRNDIKHKEDQHGFRDGYFNTYYNCEFIIRMEANEGEDEDYANKLSIFIKIPGNIKFYKSSGFNSVWYYFFPGDILYREIKTDKLMTFKEIRNKPEYFELLSDKDFDWSQFYGGKDSGFNFEKYYYPSEESVYYQFVTFNKNTEKGKKIIDSKGNEIFEITEYNTLANWKTNNNVQIWTKQGDAYTFFKTKEEKERIKIDLFDTEKFKREDFCFIGLESCAKKDYITHYLFQQNYDFMNKSWIFDDDVDVEKLTEDKKNFYDGVYKFCFENYQDNYSILDIDGVNKGQNHWSDQDLCKTPELSINFDSFIDPKSIIYKPYNYGFNEKKNETEYIEKLKKNLYTGLDKNGDFTSELIWEYNETFTSSGYSFVDYNWNLRLSEFKEIPSAITWRDSDDAEEIYSEWNFLKKYYEEEGLSANKFQIKVPSARNYEIHVFAINSGYYNSPFRLPKMSRASYNIGTLVGHNKGTISSVVINGLERKNTSNFVGFIGGIAGSQDKGTISDISAIISDDFNEKYTTTNKYNFTSAEYSAMKQEGYMVTYNCTPILPEGALSRTNKQYSYSDAISQAPQWFSAYENKNDLDVTNCVSFKLRPIFNVGGVIGKLTLSNPFTNNGKTTYRNTFKNIKLYYTNKRNGYIIENVDNSGNNSNVYSNYGTLFGKIEYNFDDINYTNVSGDFAMQDIKFLGLWQNKDYSADSLKMDAIGKVEFETERLQNIHRFSAEKMNNNDKAVEWYIQQPFLPSNSEYVTASTVGPVSLMDYCLDIPMFHNIMDKQSKPQTSADLFHYTLVGSSNPEDYKYTTANYPGYLFLSGNEDLHDVTGNSINFKYNWNSDFYNKSITSDSAFSAANETYKTYYRPNLPGKENNILVSISGESENSTKRIYGFNTKIEKIKGGNIASSEEINLKEELGKTYEKNKIFDKEEIKDEYYYYTYSSNYEPTASFSFTKNITFLRGPSKNGSIQGYTFEDLEDPSYEFDTDKKYEVNYLNIGKTFSPSEIRKRLNNLTEEEKLITTAFSANASAGFGGILVTDDVGNNIMYIENEDEIELNGNSWYYKINGIKGQNSNYGMVLEVE